MKIICHQWRHDAIRYIEQDYSAHQLRAMSAEELLADATARGNVVYVSYPDYLNVIGRHLTEGGMNASDIDVYYELNGELKQTCFARPIRDGVESSAYQIKNWPYGYFY